MHKSEWYNPLPTQADNTRLNKVLSADAAPKLPFRQVLLISKKKGGRKVHAFSQFWLLSRCSGKYSFYHFPVPFREENCWWHGEGEVPCIVKMTSARTGVLKNSLREVLYSRFIWWDWQSCKLFTCKLNYQQKLSCTVAHRKKKKKVITRHHLCEETKQQSFTICFI